MCPTQKYSVFNFNFQRILEAVRVLPPETFNKFFIEFREDNVFPHVLCYTLIRDALHFLRGKEALVV